jgi:hypothetical protein
MMTRCLSVALPACLSALVLCGCVFVARPRPTADPGEQGDRPVYVVVQEPEKQGPPNVRTTNKRKKTPPAHAPGHGNRRVFRYHYYPMARVYFAPDRKRYYWLSPRGWRVGTTLPKQIVIDGEVSVTVELDSDVPYVHHAKVEAAHSGRGKAKGKAKGKTKGNPAGQGK